MAEFRRNHRYNHRRYAAGGNGDYDHDPREEEIVRLQQRIKELELRYEPREEEERTESDYEWRNPFGDGYNYHREPPPIDPLRSLGVRVEIPEFEGRVQPDEFIEWIHTVERVFDLRDIPDNLKVKLVATKLRKHASLWWEHVRKKRLQDGKQKVKTWDKMKKLLTAKFLPANHRQDSYLDYHNLKQHNLSVEDFIMEFEKLRMRCGVDEDEEQVIARFLGALRSDISDVVQLQPYWTFDDVCRLAHRVEKQQKGKAKVTPSRPTAPTRTPTVTPIPNRQGPIKADGSGSSAPPTVL
ncbi:hypothetical protein OSB04_027438 [Centaurea solstitialis]|uniref:Retrotransposon gag domain-containing protein n=1 Tax=Centaurea solstitialis TaxID=347529 RepID=A0AA38VZQ8_9ASTR|nr:hypothetical protein OSB04_027438 [Centaurea solstitialis]